MSDITHCHSFTASRSLLFVRVDHFVCCFTLTASVAATFAFAARSAFLASFFFFSSGTDDMTIALLIFDELGKGKVGERKRESKRKKIEPSKNGRTQKDPFSNALFE